MGGLCACGPVCGGAAWVVACKVGGVETSGGHCVLLALCGWGPGSGGRRAFATMSGMCVRRLDAYRDAEPRISHHLLVLYVFVFS